FVRSPVGMTMQACRQDDIRLTTLGFSAYRYRLAAFVLAGAIAGIGGFLLINLDAYLSPSLFDWRISGIITMIVVVGGVGTLLGPVIGAFLYLLVEELTSRYTDHWLVIFGLLLLAVSLGWKRGVYGVIESTITRRRRRQEHAVRNSDRPNTPAPSYRDPAKSSAVGRQPEDVPALLSAAGLRASYGSSQTLFDISFSVGAGEVVALIGRNGMGKTTTVNAIMGMLPQTTGTIQFAGRSIANQPSHRIARCGLGLAPEGRQIFPTLTTRENLIVLARPPSFGRGVGWTLERVFALFPVLSERAEQRAATLSGGEQQMLAIGRALMTNPTLLILDEATEGLAPRIRQQILNSLAALKSSGLSILLVDKNIKALSGLVDRYYVIERGRVAWSGNNSELRHNWQEVRRYLTI
ncbi:MAG: ATP-binding cassette domain-containing protein, partial [Xanthobacteraceae bacterium]